MILNNNNCINACWAAMIDSCDCGNPTFPLKSNLANFLEHLNSWKEFNSGTV